MLFDTKIKLKEFRLFCFKFETFCIILVKVLNIDFCVFVHLPSHLFL